MGALRVGSGVGFNSGDRHLSTSLLGSVISLPSLQAKLRVFGGPCLSQSSPTSALCSLPARLGWLGILEREVVPIYFLGLSQPLRTTLSSY